MARPDLVAKNSKQYPVDYSSSEERASAESTESRSTPRMIQENNASSKSSTSTYPHSTSNIKDEVKKDIEKTRELNTRKEELWAKFSEKTEVIVVTRLDSLSSSDIGELSKWLKEKAKPQITTLSISNSDIDDKAAIALAKAIKPKSTLDKLTTLKTGHKLSKLATLELVGNTISDEGFKSLVEAIQTNRTITTLRLRVNKKIEDGGMDALVELLEKNETLKSIDLKDNGFTEEQKKRFLEASLKNTNRKIELFWL